MTRLKLDDPKTARTSLCFKQSELEHWKQYQKDNGYTSFSDFVRVCINNLIEEGNTDGPNICNNK